MGMAASVAPDRLLVARKVHSVEALPQPRRAAVRPRRRRSALLHPRLVGAATGRRGALPAAGREAPSFESDVEVVAEAAAPTARRPAPPASSAVTLSSPEERSAQNQSKPALPVSRSTCS